MFVIRISTVPTVITEGDYEAGYSRDRAAIQGDTVKFLAAMLSLLALAVGLLYALLCYFAGWMGGWDE